MISSKKIKELRELEPNNELYALMQAHIYLRGRRDEEAKWILENNNFHKFAGSLIKYSFT